MTPTRSGLGGFEAVAGRLDELLRELHGRTGEVLETVDRVEGLLDTMLAIGGDLSLPVVLEKVVEGACRIVRAKYGALGVIGGDQRLSQFITHGIDDVIREAIGPLPDGHGILGLLITDPRPLRLPDLSRHPASFGFPPNHPPMRSFLGVPVRVGTTVFGNLYLCEKETADEFSEDDEAIVIALATAAGVAINNANLYEERERRERWLTALSEITRSALAGNHTSDVLGQVARHAATITSSDRARIMMRTPAGDELEVISAHGEQAAMVLGTRYSIANSKAGQCFTLAEPVVSAIDEISEPNEDLSEGSVTYMPLLGAGMPLGVLSIMRHKAQRDFTKDTFAMLHSFANQAAVAVELGRARAERERISLFEDRDRIARDLHDTVIQQLFGAGMRLQAVAPMAGRSDVAERINDIVDTIDAAIKQLRSAIFELNRRPDDGYSLRAEILAVVREASQRGDVEASISLDGPIDSRVNAQVGANLVAVVREAMSNVVRHAGATRVNVSVALSDADVIAEVADNGKGVPSDVVRRSGLANLTDRADQLGGSCSITNLPSGGTLVHWQVPLQ